MYPPHPPGMTRSGRVPMDPFLYQPHAASLRQYAEWFRAFYPKEAKEEDDLDRQAEKEAGKRVRDGIRARWEKYKKQHAAIQLQTLFDHHKKSPWFNEKYNPGPEWANLRQRVRKEGWKNRTQQFLKDLEQGVYDPQNQKQESEDKSTAEEKPAEEAPPAEELEPVDEDMPENGPDSSIKDAGASANSRQNGNLGRLPREDDVLVMPEGNQIAIRTIPPDIGRQKIEEACGNIPGFIHLALGDPLQKRHYYRAGWMKFSEDTDINDTMTVISDKKIEGFKLHITHTSRPYHARMRQAPEVSSTPHRIKKDLEQARRVAELLEEEYMKLRSIKPGPEPSLEGKKEGGDTTMATENAGDNEHATASEKNPANGVEEENLEPLEKGSEAVERRAEKLMAELDISLEGEELEMKKCLTTLDLYLAYLRAAFNACYYCVAVCDHSEELHRKCPKHVRKPLSEAFKEREKAVTGGDDAMEDDEKPKEKERGADKTDRKSDRSDERWTEWIDNKVSMLVNRSNIDPVEFGGKSYEEELRKAVEPHIKQEDEGKFRCRSCNKLFKASSFVEKHVANKHPDLIKSLEEIPYFNNFILDPHHVQPFAHLPPPMGSTSAPPQAYGLQPSPAYSVPPMAGYYGYPPPPPQAYGAANGYDFYMSGGAHAWGGPPPSRRDDSTHRGGRLQERMGGYAYASTTDVSMAGLPAKPQTGYEPAPGEGGGGQHGGRGGRRGRAATGPPPPPPPDAKEDPRAASGRKVSYHDMDDVAEGDVELTY